MTDALSRTFSALADPTTRQWRPCRLEAKPLEDVADWVAAYRRFWDGGFDRLEDHLRSLTGDA